MPAHDLVHHGGGPRRGSIVHHGLLAPEHPMIRVRALYSHAGLVRCHHLGFAKSRQGRLALDLEARLGPAQNVGQATLADRQAEQVGQGFLQPFVGQRLKRLQVNGRCVQARAER